MPSLETLVSYIPRRLLRWCAEGRHAGAAPAGDHFQGAILFADISGFTDLTDRLARKGPAGTEELTSILNSYFRAMLRHVSEHGGDILKMAGDALVIVWESPAEGDLRDAVLRATQCAQAIQQEGQKGGTTEGVKMSVRIGISAGAAELLYLGGEADRWEILPVGEPFRQMGFAGGHAHPGEVVLSSEAWSALGSAAAGASVGEGFVRLEKLPTALPAEPLPQMDCAGLEPRSFAAFLPKPIRFLLHDAGEAWLADLRPVTSFFVFLPDRPESPPALEQMQALTVAVQQVVARFEGAMIGWGVDEKGMSLVSAFGLPPTSHEDDPSRAIQAAMATRSALETAGFEACYGLATGRAFCGSIGSDERHDYTVIGRSVNLAARLAHQAAGAILCDEQTFHASAARVQFSAQAPLRLKGIPQPIPVFQPTGLATTAGSVAKMVGHEAEFATVRGAIDSLKSGETFIGVIEGEAGIGKSTLIQQWWKAATSAGVRLLRGAAESINAKTPYFVWRSILGSLLGVAESGTNEQRRAQFLAACQGRDWEGLAPLLEDVLEIGLVENPITAQIAGKIRADNVRELIATILGETAATGPLGLVLEDCHWMDSASLAVVEVVARRVQPMVMLLSSRILTGEKEHLLDALLKVRGAQRLRLGPLDRNDCVALAAQRLSVRRLAPAVAELIVAKSQGNPFFSVEIAFALREHGFVMIEGDECKPVPGLDLSTVKFPDNVQGIIMRRVDSLDPAVQLTAKVASVIGSTFSTPMLRETYPVDAGKLQIEENLGVLQEERLVLHEDDPAYAFSHAIVEEAIYDRLLGAQRKTLHERVARAMEREQAGDFDPVASLLAHHWLNAGDEAKAGFYFGLAGLHAVHSGAYQEGLEFLDRAVALSKTPVRSPEETLRDGGWQALRAEALFGLGKIEGSAYAFREAVRILGRPVVEEPQNSHLLQQIGARVIRGFAGRKACLEKDRERVRMIAGCYEMLSLLDLFSNRMTSSLSAALESLRHAEQLGDCAEYARALATMALASSLVPSRVFAERYARAALKVATRLGHDSTLARVREFIGMYLMGEGRWKEAAECFEQAIAGFQLVGDRRREIECTCLLSTWHHYQGDFAQRVILGQRVFTLAQATGDLQAQAWGLLDQIESLLNLGEFDRVRVLGDELRSHIGRNIYGADDIMAYGLLAALELRIGRLDRALVEAEKALAIMTVVTPTIVYNLEAYAAVADVFLESWRRTHAGDPARETIAGKARQACECTGRFAKIFRLGQSRTLLLSGVERELSGDAGKALRLVRDGLARAIQLKMPYEEALAHRLLARLLPAHDRSKADEHDKAVHLFTRLSAKYDLNATAEL